MLLLQGAQKKPMLCYQTLEQLVYKRVFDKNYIESLNR